MEKVLGGWGIKAFEGRGISIETAVRFGIYTARQEDKAIIPDIEGKIVVFPFREDGKVVNEKYRGPGKRFWQWSENRRATFWNAEVLDDPTLEHDPLIITEGEIDALSAIDCGFPLTVSVPDGAPPAAGELPPEDVDGEATGKFEFVWNNRDKLKKVSGFILAVDNDAPGKRLEAELLRRFTAARCRFVTYPEGCKDLNDVLVQHGPEAVRVVLREAKPYPVDGLYELDEFPEPEAFKSYPTGWPLLDPLIQLWEGEFVVVTGVPGHGKSTWVLNLLVNLSRLYGWRSAMLSPEMRTKPHLRGKLRRIISNRGDGDGDRPDRFINEHIKFIGSTRPHDAPDLTVAYVIDRAIDAVWRYGIKVLVIDPWNELEHARARDESMTDYIGRAIRDLKAFAASYNVIVIVVAHPTKAGGNKDEPVGLYDIEGSAHWANKPDHGVVIERNKDLPGLSTVWISKVRFQPETGEPGSVNMRFDRFSCRFEQIA